MTDTTPPLLATRDTLVTTLDRLVGSYCTGLNGEWVLPINRRALVSALAAALTEDPS